MHSRSSFLPGLLAVAFLCAMFMGTGPGVLFANRAATWFGFPRLYIWGLFWCCVEASLVVAAYFLLWKVPDEESDRS